MSLITLVPELAGQLGQKVAIGVGTTFPGGVELLNAQSLVQIGRQRIENAIEAVVTISGSSDPSDDRLIGLFFHLVWGSNGTANELIVTGVQSGTRFPLKGSYFRVGCYIPPGAAVRTTVGASIGKGTAPAPIIYPNTFGGDHIAAAGATITIGGRTNTAVLPIGNVQTFPLSYMESMKVMRGPATVPFTLGLPAIGQTEIDVPANAEMDWTPIPGDLIGPDGFEFRNNDAVTATTRITPAIRLAL